MSNERAEIVRKIKGAISEKRAKDLGNNWPVNRSDAFGYFSRHLNTFEIVTAEMSKWNPENEDIIYLDIAGRASFEPNPDVPIFSEQYSFSLAPAVASDREVNDQFVGDVFDDKEFEEMLDFFKSKEKELSLVTFNPVGGLFRYRTTDPNEQQFLKKIFWKRLLSLLSIMRIGGLIFIAGDPSFRSYNFLKNVFNENPERLIKHGLVPLQTEDDRCILLKKFK